MARFRNPAPLLALLAGASLAGAQVDPARVVATVNGEEIKGDEYYRRMEYLPGVGKKVGNAVAELPPGLLTLEQLITERLVLQLAKDRGVAPTDAEVELEVAERKRNNPDLLTMWTNSGRTEADFVNQVRFDLAQFKLATFGVTVTDQEVESVYKKRAEEYQVPKRYQLSVIVVRSADAKTAVDADLAAKKPFPDVAKARSEDLTKNSGGAYGVVPADALNNSTKTAIEAVKLGGVTDWIETKVDGDAAYVKFRVDDILAPETIPLDANLKKRIRKQRMLELGAAKNDIRAEMDAMRKKARIDIKQPEFAKAYQAFIQAYLAQPSSVTKGGG